MEDYQMTPRSLNNLLPSLAQPTSYAPQSMIYLCPNCGPVAPVYFAGRWRRVGCQCERAARLAREEQEQKERELARAMQRSYNWLEAGPEEQRSSSHLVNCTFESFDPTKQIREDLIDLAKRAMCGCIGFASKMIEEEDFYGNIILYGPYGTGKSHLLAAICNELRAHGKIARFAVATEFIGEVQRRRFSDEDAESLLHLAKTAHFLVLDDVDKVPPTDARESLYNDIINYRCNHRMPTGITLNQIGELESHIGRAAASRLTKGLTSFDLKGIDVRKS